MFIFTLFSLELVRMKFEHIETWGFEHAIRGMRNPLESWKKSDSKYESHLEFIGGNVISRYIIGKNDLELMQKLIRAGSEHRKFMRQIMVSVDITAPLYWWKEFDTYKVGTVANSTSTMHKLASTPIDFNCFEMGDALQEISLELPFYGINFLGVWESLISFCELLRKKYLETKDKRYWKELIRLLPESWLQTRTVTMNYENLLSMVHQRKNHKLTEWSIDFINWVKTLPYAEELLFLEK